MFVTYNSVKIGDKLFFDVSGTKILCTVININNYKGGKAGGPKKLLTGLDENGIIKNDIICKGSLFQEPNMIMKC